MAENFPTKSNTISFSAGNDYHMDEYQFIHVTSNGRRVVHPKYIKIIEEKLNK